MSRDHASGYRSDTIAILTTMSPPVSVGHYKITAKLGEGGMGAVYRATDTKLHREVAIKILPPAFAEDAVRIRRLKRGVQVLASLNHPQYRRYLRRRAGRHRDVGLVFCQA